MNELKFNIHSAPLYPRHPHLLSWVGALSPRRACPLPRLQGWCSPRPPGHVGRPGRKDGRRPAIWGGKRRAKTTVNLERARECGSLERRANSQPRVDDDGVGLDGEAKDPGVFRCVPEDHLLALGVLLGEQADLWNAVVLKVKQTDQECVNCASIMVDMTVFILITSSGNWNWKETSNIL